MQSHITYNDSSNNDSYELVIRVRVNGVIAEGTIATGNLQIVPTPEQIAERKRQKADFDTAVGWVHDAHEPQL